MRWRKIATLSIVLGATLFVGVLATPAYRWVQAELARRAELPDPVVATSDETRAILAGVLRDEEFGGVPPPPPEPGAPQRVGSPRNLLLSDRSLCLSRKQAQRGCGDGDPLLLYAELDPTAPLKLRTELVLANAERHPLALGIAGTRVLPQAEFDRIFDKGGWWNDFYRQFPDTSGLMRVTRPVLTKDRSEALILVSHACDGLCGSVTLFAMQRSGSQWRVAREFVLAMR